MVCVEQMLNLRAVVVVVAVMQGEGEGCKGSGSS